MDNTNVAVAGYLLFAGQQSTCDLPQLRRILPPINGLAQFRHRPTRVSPALELAAQVSAVLVVSQSSYPGSLKQVLEGFVFTFLDSLKPRNPAAGRGWSKALRRWQDRPRDIVFDTEQMFEIGPDEMFGVVRLISTEFQGEVTRAILTQREIAPAPWAEPQVATRTWPRLATSHRERDAIP